MGDRGNIVIRDTGNGTVGYTYLYTHWGGYNLPTTLHRALTSPAGKGRQHDLPYLARIIFCRMLADRGETLDGETGFGVSAFLTDNEYPLLVVDARAQLIWAAPEENPEAKVAPAYTFAQFIALESPTWDDLTTEDRIHPDAPDGCPVNDGERTTLPVIGDN